LRDLVAAVGGHHLGILVVRFDNDPRHNLTERAIAIALGTPSSFRHSIVIPSSFPISLKSLLFWSNPFASGRR
jgi:hypothetical protein